MSKVTVVIATRNRRAALCRTVGRLIALPDRPAAVVVVDNASEDGTSAVVAERFPDVRVIRLSRNEGAVARNHGVTAATTPYVAFADDDSWWAPGALSRAAELFDAHPRLALIAAKTLVGSEERLDPMAGVMAAAPLGVPDDLPGPAVLGFLACSAVVRRGPFLACEGFDPVVFFMGEEQRLAWDLHNAGWGLAYCDDIVAHHHPGPMITADRVGKEVLAARNRALTAWMRRPYPIALAQTAALLRNAVTDAGGRRVVLQLLTRLPAAVARRRAPRRELEAALRQLDVAPALPSAGGSPADHARSNDRSSAQSCHRRDKTGQHDLLYPARGEVQPVTFGSALRQPTT
jgi:GT2 family glycosyltransferase